MKLLGLHSCLIPSQARVTFCFSQCFVISEQQFFSVLNLYHGRHKSNIETNYILAGALILYWRLYLAPIVKDGKLCWSASGRRTVRTWLPIISAELVALVGIVSAESWRLLGSSEMHTLQSNCHILNTAVCFTTNSNLGFDYHNYWRGFLYRGNDSTKEGTLSLTCENAVCGTEQDIKPLETLSWRN